MKLTIIEIIIGVFVIILGFLQHWIVGIIMILIVGLIHLVTSDILKDKNTCNKLEEDACGLASGSKVRETLSSPVSYNHGKGKQ